MRLFKSGKDNNFGLTLISIVAIVAIVGLVSLLNPVRQGVTGAAPAGRPDFPPCWH